MKLWGSRMEQPPDEAARRFNASLPFDIRLFQEDIDGSQAWARALERAGVIGEDELGQIVAGLEVVRREFAEAGFSPLPSDEDIHTAVERRLTEEIGPVAGKLHTGRSRNDQVATDFRLWVMRACNQVGADLQRLAGALVALAEAQLEAPMPGYTHLQPAQPVTWGHWVLWHAWALRRDAERFERAQASAAVLPLGAAALAGTTYPIDRQALADDLGFEAVAQNSLDAVSDRDFALEFLFAAAALGVHLSRLAEQLILFSNPAFGFVELDDAYATGSSLMPQKKNPDVLELARGKAGRLIGNLAGLLATLKALPSVYDKDLQEDKQPVFDAFDTHTLLLPALTGLVASLRVNPERMAAQLSPALLATELADRLVAQGVPFREAHDLVGRAVREAERLVTPLDQLPLEAFKAIDDRFDAELFQAFDLDAALARRRTVGGTSPQAVRKQLRALRSSWQLED